MNNKPQINLTGKQFGKLTVICYVGGGKWRCKCECGNVIETRSAKLKSGKRKSCNHAECEVMFKMLKPYVFDCLNRFGNTVISEKTLKHYGEKKLLDELHRRGFDCRIRDSSNTGVRCIIIEVEQGE